jgi:Cu+-exporting ATPase
VERALRGVPNVTDVSVNLATEMARIVVNGTPPVLEDLQRAVSRAGFTAELIEAERSVTQRDVAAEDAATLGRARRRMVLAWALVVPLMAWMMPEMLSGRMWPEPRAAHAGMLILSFPAIFIAGFETLRSAFVSARNRTPNMDVLIALGSTTAFATGVAALLAVFGVLPHVHDFSAVGAMIMAFHLTGRFIEARARGRASQTIKRLLTLGAKTARVSREGAELEVPVSDVRVNDVMLIRPGEKVPTDGLVIEGQSAVDESMVSGESLPVARSAGELVIGGTINTSGFLKVRATGVGENTFLAQVIRLVEEAQTSAVPVQAVADRVVRVFVPVVLVLAAVTLFVWMVMPGVMQTISAPLARVMPWIPTHGDVVSRAIFAAMATLVIACPCALGLATPTALMVGSGVGAANGILIRRGEAIQRMREVTTMVFDKTGTITTGAPFVADILPVAGHDARSVLSMAAEAEAGSDHPLAKAIVAEARSRGLDVGSPMTLEEFPGEGVESRTRAGTVRLGTREFVRGEAMGLENAIEERADAAQSWIWVALDGRIAGAIALADRVRDDAAGLVSEIRGLGIEPIMLTGDHERVARAVAAVVGIDRVVAGVRPKDKVAEIQRLQTSGEVVAMVGDGINDAPALAQADIGLAIGTGSDIAVDAGDVVLVGGDLRAVVRAVRLSQATFSKIRQNLFWAFFYNVVAIPVAMLGLLHPLMAEVAMAMSSINVVLNAQRLTRVRLDG